MGRRCHVSRGSSHLRQKTYGPRTLGGYHGPGPASSHGAAGEVRVLRLPAGWGAERETERPCTRRGGSASTRAPRLVLVSACRGAAGWLTWGKNLPSTRRCRKRTVLSGGGPSGTLGKPGAEKRAGPPGSAAGARLELVNQPRVYPIQLDPALPSPPGIPWPMSGLPPAPKGALSASFQLVSTFLRRTENTWLFQNIPPKASPPQLQQGERLLQK